MQMMCVGNDRPSDLGDLLSTRTGVSAQRGLLADRYVSGELLRLKMYTNDPEATLRALVGDDRWKSPQKA